MRRIEIYDTTLRDGAQGEGVCFSLQDKLALTERLDAVGFDYIEGGYPASNEKDLQYFQQVRKLNLNRICVCAFGMTRRKGAKAEQDQGLKALLDSGAKTITLVGKSSILQVKEVLRTSGEENLAMIAESVACLVAAGREVIFDAEHFFDGWKLDPEHARAAIQAAAAAGAEGRALRHQRRVDARGSCRDHPRGRGRGCRARGHPLPQRLRHGGGQLVGRR